MAATLQSTVRYTQDRRFGADQCAPGDHRHGIALSVAAGVCFGGRDAATSQGLRLHQPDTTGRHIASLMRLRELLPKRVPEAWGFTRYLKSRTTSLPPLTMTIITGLDTGSVIGWVPDSC